MNKGQRLGMNDAGDGRCRRREVGRAPCPMAVLGRALLAAYGRALVATSRAVPGPRDGPAPHNWGAAREHAVRAVAAAAARPGAAPRLRRGAAPRRGPAR